MENTLPKSANEPNSKPLSRTQAYAEIYKATFAGVRGLYKSKKASTKGEATNEALREMSTMWSKRIQRALNVELKVEGEAHTNSPCLMVGNHISYLDIPMVFDQKQVVFVTKEEVKKWPLFGSACELAGMVFVKRNSPKSRGQAGAAVAKKINEDGKSVLIFPSGTTCIDEQKPWRKGAFQIARDYKIPLQPVAIDYHPLRPVAYIDDDFFPKHLWDLTKQKKIEARIKFGEPVQIQDPRKDCEEIWDWVKGELKRFRAEREQRSS